MKDQDRKPDPLLRAIDITIIILIISCLGVGVIVGYNKPSRGTIELIEGTEISGVPSQNVTKSFSATDSDLVFLNEPPSVNSHWFYSSDYYGDEWGVPVVESRKARSSLSSEGLLLELSGAEVRFTTGVRIPLNACSTLNYATSLGVLNGQVEINFRVWFRKSPYTVMGDNLTREKSISLTPANGTANLSFNIPIESFNASVPQLSIESWVRITIESQFPTRLLVGNVSISGQATYDLCRVSVDVQALDGRSIYAPPYMTDLWPYPLINLTRQDAPSTSSLFYILRSNDVLYLEPGNYSGFAYWSPRIVSDSDNPYWQSRLAINITIATNETAIWEIRMQCTRLFITIDPMIPETFVQIQTVDDHLYYSIGSFNASVSDFIYLPISNGSDSFDIFIKTNPSTQYNYRDLPVVSYFPMENPLEIDSNHEWHLEVKLPIDVFLGVGFIGEDITIINLGVITLLLMIGRVLIHFKKIGFISILKDPRLIPFVILCISLIFPWAEYSHTTSEWLGSDSTILFTKISPLALLLMWSKDSIIILQPGIYWFESYIQYHIGWMISITYDACALFLSSVFLFWIPVIYCFTTIGRGDKRNADYLLYYLLALGAPTLLACLPFIPNSRLIFEGLGIGAYLAMSTIPVFLLVNLLYRFRTRLMDTQ
nr:MAG: hypothetical protein AM325_15705 [Candidatus Thorarchaeota archaeon SMTZ1-45]